VHRYTRRHGFLLGIPERITFDDSSALYFQPSSPSCKKQKNTRSSNVGDPQQQHEGIPLPNPHYLRIHSTLAGVLHMSGAGEEIDLVIERSGLGGAPGVLVGGDFERLCKMVTVRKDLAVAMNEQMMVK
jgi:hypothetical protein